MSHVFKFIHCWGQERLDYCMCLWYIKCTRAHGKPTVYEEFVFNVQGKFRLENHMFYWLFLFLWTYAALYLKGEIHPLICWKASDIYCLNCMFSWALWHMGWKAPAEHHMLGKQVMLKCFFPVSTKVQCNYPMVQNASQPFYLWSEQSVSRVSLHVMAAR